MAREDGRATPRQAIEPRYDGTASVVFGPSARDYGDLFSDITIGYRVSETAILGAMGKYFAAHRSPYELLEQGAGTGQATLRIVTALNKAKVDYSLVSTEPNPDMISKGADLNLTPPYIARAIIPHVQAKAEDLSQFSRNNFDIVFGTQVVHWIDDLPRAFAEAHRVLKPGGVLIHAGSGIIKGEPDLDRKHFTKHPSYQEFLRNIQDELEKDGTWSPSNGEFSPVNPLVNPLFHRYSVDQIEEGLRSRGFTDLTRSLHSAPIDRKEMLLRMMAGSVSMFIFAGQFAENIGSERRAEIVDKAREKVLREHPELLDQLDTHPAEDGTILFAARKTV
jgi:ubiquinone/menaquinone biosynthesis C-methylase UbiE